MISRLDIRHVSYFAAAITFVVGGINPRPMAAQPHYESIGWTPDVSAIALGTYRDGDAKIIVAAAEVAGLDERPVVEAAEAASESASGSGADTAPRKPRVAILIYDGVQIIDHAAPWEVLGQYSLNEVFTVAKDTTPVTTFMGMRVLPSYGFADHPEPDVVVIPGGDARDVRTDPEVIDWIRRHAPAVRYVLGICSGVMLLAEADLLEGRRATTFYNLLDRLAAGHPEVRVVDDELVVEDEKFITTTGTGIEASLRIVELLHGEPWARVVALNMEFEPLPDHERTPRARLADLNLPSSVYGAFPWREAELIAYEGNMDRWRMSWRFGGDDTGGLPELAAALAEGLAGEGWELSKERLDDGAWTSDWRLRVRDDDTWEGEVRLLRGPAGSFELQVEVASGDGG